MIASLPPPYEPERAMIKLELFCQKSESNLRFPVATRGCVPNDFGASAIRLLRSLSSE